MADEADDGVTTIADVVIYPAGAAGEIIHNVVLAGPSPGITLFAMVYPTPDGGNYLTIKCGGVAADGEAAAREQLVELLKYLLEIAEETSSEDQTGENIA